MATKARQTRADLCHLRAYQVGFGDCFLVTFHYGEERPATAHVLIDFGSTASRSAATCRSTGGRGHQGTTAGKLTPSWPPTAIAITFRGLAANREDHRLSESDVVVQPWTEHPERRADATAAARRPAARKASSALAACTLRESSLRRFALRTRHGKEPA